MVSQLEQHDEINLNLTYNISTPIFQPEEGRSCNLILVIMVEMGWKWGRW
jgi:hypothetical protein